MLCSRTDLDGRFEFKKDGLRDEDLPGLGAKETDLRLEKLNLLSRTAASHFQQSVDDGIQIDIVLISHGVRAACCENELKRE